MWESRVLRRAFERLELHEGKLSRAVLRGGGGGDVTSLPDAWVGNHPGLPGPEFCGHRNSRDTGILRSSVRSGRPYGAEDWVEAISHRLGIVRKPRRRGRPPREKML